MTGVRNAPAQPGNTPERVREAAQRVLGYETLHPGQEEAVSALLGGRDTLAILPTGSGKTAIYELAGELLGGPTVVISPLIALHRDQVSSLREHGLSVAALNSSLPVRERHDVLASVEQRQIGFLLLSPEQLADEDVLAKLASSKPVLAVVDEAHCVSEWGHDFRPDYLRLSNAFERLGRPVLLALTATAAPLVRDEIVQRLEMRDPLIIVGGFDRPNIHLAVERFDDEHAKRRAIAGAVRDAQKPLIVYAATHRHVEEMAETLSEDGCR
ncbi:MAG TPA: DEAD/DEAH box helicase, partial [Candidatus Sulfotelmatobacter sp.]|nr:DEAD/DEAH box helicase [Candidatus Sulfotelmatobacter sp.]